MSYSLEEILRAVANNNINVSNNNTVTHSNTNTSQTETFNLAYYNLSPEVRVKFFIILNVKKYNNNILCPFR
jgi:hypothetical protein